MPVQPVFHIESLQTLYKDVQQQKLFPDSKFFVDCIPAAAPQFIVNEYEKEKQLPGFSLRDFVHRYFIVPEEIVSNYSSANKPLLQHLNDLWPALSREPGNEKGTLIPLPYPYIVPGGRFREVYYWDSYFTMLGLQVSKRFDIMENMVANFAYLIDTFGHIPNANRTYYLSRSQPPFFTLMTTLLATEKGDAALLQYQPQLEKEYAFWMDGEKDLTPTDNRFRRVVLLPDGSILNRYWDDKPEPRPEACLEDIEIAGAAGDTTGAIYSHIRAAAESGWDFSTRWFKNGADMTSIQTTDLIPVDLNCLLLHTEEVLLKIYTLKQLPLQAANFAQKIGNRKKAIQQYCWDEGRGFYFDYCFTTQTPGSQYTIAAAYPLFFAVANEIQAQKVAKQVEEKFLQQGGVATTLCNSGQQWDLPNGWAPLQWMTYKGLKNYGHHKLAAEIKNRWMAANEKVYAETGKMMEKYDVTNTAIKAGGGEYPNQDGFGWTNGVYLAFTREK